MFDCYWNMVTHEQIQSLLGSSRHKIKVNIRVSETRRTNLLRNQTVNPKQEDLISKPHGQAGARALGLALLQKTHASTFGPLCKKERSHYEKWHARAPKGLHVSVGSFRV